jgi:trehalose-phosphatase
VTPPDSSPATPLSHASQRLDDWLARWRAAGRLVLLLDFDGTLAPIVARPEMAALPERARLALERLGRRGDVDIAVVSGRGLADARERAGLAGVAYAGNHGMEIEGPGFRHVHAEAAAARPRLERVLERLREPLAAVPGAIMEDKGLTLSVHYRLVPPEQVGEVRRAVEAAVAGEEGIRLTEGKRVIEIRPAVEWDKGRAVEFLLEALNSPPGTPVLYLGDDTTDEDAFRALASSGAGEGIVVADSPPAGTAARAYLRSPEEVAEFLETMAAD